MSTRILDSARSGRFAADHCEDRSRLAFAALSQCRAQAPAAPAGFSRIDLVTVIGVLVLLVLLLTPALAHTRLVDQAFQCRNNLRQLIQGWRMYADDNNGNLALAFDWVAGWESYGANNADNTNVNYLVKGALGPYVKNPAVYKCPADQSVALEGRIVYPRVRTLSMSQTFSRDNEGHLEDAGSPPNYWRHYQKSADMILPAPADLWVLIDENPDSINDAAFGVRMSPYSSVWQDGPTTLHDGSCGFAFADGHVELKEWADLRTLAMRVTYSQSFPYGLVQTNNQDIMWVQDRTTAPK